MANAIADRNPQSEEAGMQPFGEIEKVRGAVVLVGLSGYRQRDRIDIREWREQRLRDPDSRIPTKAGISLPLIHLPRLLAALRQLEAAAIERGQLKAHHYTRAGLEPPAELLHPAT